MGTLSVPIRLQGPAGRAIETQALVDTGATHTLLPANMLAQLGVQPIERVQFHLADERTVEYGIGEVRIRLDGRERTTVVIFAQRVQPLCLAPSHSSFSIWPWTP